MTLLAAFQSQRTALGDGATPDGLCWLSPPQELQGAEVRFGSVSDEESLARAAFSDPVDVVVSCLASRTGGKVTCCPLTDLSQSGGHKSSGGHPAGCKAAGQQCFPGHCPFCFRAAASSMQSACKRLLPVT